MRNRPIPAPVHLASAIRTLYIIACVCLCAPAWSQDADVTLPASWSDHMVLQREAPLHFEGTAAPGQRVSISLAGKTRTARADKKGRWQVKFRPMKAGGPYTLTAGGREFHDVYIGEVWLCSGQSNMEFRLNQDAEFRNPAGRQQQADPNGPAPSGDGSLRKTAADERLHFYNMRARWLTANYEWSEAARDSTDRLLYFDTTRGWERCTDQSAMDKSAIAYYFGRMLADSLGCHVGLVINAVGGSPAESWIDRPSLEATEPGFYKDWTQCSLVQDWVRGRSIRNVGDTGHRHPYQPSYLFEAGILPLKGITFRGAIWYQGESNAQDIGVHEMLFPLLLKCWRKNLESASGPLPFYMVQLSSIAPRLTWPEFRDSQRRLAEQNKGVWMAISSDVGDSLDVHPRLKRPVGERLATLALINTYGQHINGIMPYAPTHWSRTADALYLGFGNAEPRFRASPRNMFEVRDVEGQWHEALPTVDGTRIRLTLPQGVQPSAVRYGWQPFTRACVTSQTGWPLSTFMMELTPKTQKK